MKVLSLATFAHPDHYGGAERVITAVAEGLAARGHAVTLLTGRVAGSAERERRAGVDVVRYPFVPSPSPRFYRSVWRGVRAALRAGVGAEADVLHLHQLASALPALAPGGSSLRPRVLSFYAPYHLEFLARHREGRDTGRPPLGARAWGAGLARADRWLLGRADAILVLSRFSARQVAELCPAAAGRTRLAPAGVDTGRFHPPADEGERRCLAAGFGLPADQGPTVLTVRRLVPRMGVPDLLEAAARLHRGGTPLALAIAGSGPEREALQVQAASLGLADRVSFLGRVPEERLPDLYRAADLFALPTRSLEGFGMATAEALASGLPVVATDAGATGELLHGLRGSRLVPAGDVPALAAALGELLGDAGERARAATEARRRAERALGWDGHLGAFEAAAAGAREVAAR